MCPILYTIFITVEVLASDHSNYYVIIFIISGILINYLNDN